MLCPSCKATGEIIADTVRYADGHCGYGVTFCCPRCKGTGEVPDATAEWIERGERLRKRRVEGQPYRTGREEAKLLGVSLIELNRQENGKKPVTLLDVPRP